jgi:SpoVK/Ycf46/Vps4 family AAA+-type ATPase
MMILLFICLSITLTLGLVFRKDEYSSTWLGEVRMKCVGGSARNVSDTIESIECNNSTVNNITVWTCTAVLPAKTSFGKCIVSCDVDGTSCILRYHLDFNGSVKIPSSRLDELFSELNKLTGLSRIKTQVRQIANLITMLKIRMEHGLPTLTGNQHLVFLGNPGTGKTMVARLLASIYHELGLLSKGHMIETDRSKLVVGYIGQTANNTRDIIESALGGVLLIDEAYALAPNSERDFGHEAIFTLVKYMEDYRDDLVVIATGYTEEMMEFLAVNPGLRSRFGKIITFPDYSTGELVEIFQSMGRVYQYEASPEALKRVEEWADAQERTRYFGNAREVRSLFERAVNCQATRIIQQDSFTISDLFGLTVEDIQMAIDTVIV